MIYTDFSLSLELSSLIIFGSTLLVVVIFFIVKLCKKKKTNYVVSAVDVGLSPNFTLSLDNSDRQIAYKVLVDIKTRTIAVKIDLDLDNIKVINDSYHSCFLATRELIKEIPVHKLEKEQGLFELLTAFLNNLLRPYLTKWGALYSEWYENAQKENEELTKEDKKNYKSFIEIQRSFPQYEELTKDLLEVNEKVGAFSTELEKIAFNKK